MVQLETNVAKLQEEVRKLSHKANQRLREIERLAGGKGTKNRARSSSISYAYQEAIDFLSDSTKSLSKSGYRFREKVKTVTDAKKLRELKRHVERFLARPTSFTKTVKEVQNKRRNKLLDTLGVDVTDFTDEEITDIFNDLKDIGIFEMFGSDEAMDFGKYIIENNLSRSQVKDWARKSVARALGKNQNYDRFGSNDAKELLEHYKGR